MSTGKMFIFWFPACSALAVCIIFLGKTLLAKWNKSKQDTTPWATFQPTRGLTPACIGTRLVDALNARNSLQQTFEWYTDHERDIVKERIAQTFKIYQRCVAGNKITPPIGYHPGDELPAAYLEEDVSPGQEFRPVLNSEGRPTVVLSTNLQHELGIKRGSYIPGVDRYQHDLFVAVAHLRYHLICALSLEDEDKASRYEQYLRELDLAISCWKVQLAVEISSADSEKRAHLRQMLTLVQIAGCYGVHVVIKEGGGTHIERYNNEMRWILYDHKNKYVYITAYFNKFTQWTSLDLSRDLSIEPFLKENVW